MLASATAMVDAAKSTATAAAASANSMMSPLPGDEREHAEV